MARKRKYEKKENSRTRTKTNSQDGKVSGAEPISGSDPLIKCLDPSLVNAAASFSSYRPYGTFYDNVGIDAFSPAVVAAFKVIPTIGPSLNANSAVNMAARNIYSFVRHVNSGHSNFESADLMMYLLAIDSLYQYHTWMTRLYGMINLYSVENRSVPLSLFEAENVDYTDLVNNKTDLLFFINQYAYMAGSLCAPMLPLYLRHFDLYRGVFTDSATMRSQLYLMVPDGFWIYQGYTDKTGGKLNLESVPGTGVGDKITFNDIKNFAYKLINQLKGDEDINIICGDILHAYGSDGVMQFPVVESTYTVIPAYDSVFLDQIRNADIIWPANENGHRYVDIYQEDGLTKSRVSVLTGLSNTDNYKTKPVDYADAALANKDRLFNHNNPAATSVDYVTMTRFTVGNSGPLVDIPVGSNAQGTTIADLNSYGTEIISSVRLYYPKGDKYTSIAYTTFEVTDVQDLTIASHFSCLPRKITRDTNQIYGLYGNFDIISVASQEDISQVHDAVLLAAFNVPLIGKGRA